MSARIFATQLITIVILVTSAAAAGLPGTEYQRANNPVPIHGGPAGPAAKAARDTFLLMGPTGSDAAYIGDFESSNKVLDPGNPFSYGWTSVDITQRTTTNWQVTDFAWSDVAPVPGYAPISGSYSAWCGDETIRSCDGVVDPTGGYGSGWNDLLEFRGSVTDNAASCTVTLAANADVFSEPGYDGTTLQAEKFDVGFVFVSYWEGAQTVAINESVTYLPGEYMGAAADEVVLVFQFESDGGWDDTDCSFPSAGAFILDDVVITSDNGVAGTEDFESGDFSGIFDTRLAQGVGDFTWIWSGLNEVDPCASNYSHQVAFIDNGLVVPGTGGTPCQDWCYGPGGFIVTTTGGLAGPESHIHCGALSPVMDWAMPEHDGAKIAMDIYRHEDLSGDAPGMFYSWAMRTSNTGDPADIEDARWVDKEFVYYGGPDYIRMRYDNISHMLVPNPTHLQLLLTVYELGWVWGWNGNDGYPAPYFDNIRFSTFEVVGPGLATREIDLAQDNFPASGTLDMSDPAALSVRFDGSQDISPPTHHFPAVADSFCFDAVVTRQDAVLDPPTPTLHYKVKRNPVFDPYRTSALPAAGSVACGQVMGYSGLPVPDRYFGDLDDEGFLFPGDILHYYLTATDRDTNDESTESSIMPADTTGFSDFVDALNYSPSYTVRCLPTISDLAGNQPPILFWNDFANRGGQQEWYGALHDLGLERGVDFDEYYTNGPSSGVGNGLGGRATSLQLANYDVMLYTAGDLSVNTISNGDLNSDSGPDAALVMAWLDSGGKHLLATGDDLASALANEGLVTNQLLADYFGLVVSDSDIRDLIGGQMAPRVLPVAGNPVFLTVPNWIAYGGCRVVNRFDAVTPLGGAIRLAVFADASGADGGYPYSAATLAAGVGTAGTSEVVSLPYDFMFIYTDPDEGDKAPARLAARTRLLRDVLSRFGSGVLIPPVSGASVPTAFATRHHPNPFNPRVTISLTVPRPGHLTVKVFDLRGRRVRSLFDERVDAATSLAWDGKDDRGGDLASGVYFYEARMHGEVQVGKMMLVR